jgi:Tol biopolymer transport system component
MQHVVNCHTAWRWFLGTVTAVLPVAAGTAENRLNTPEVPVAATAIRATERQLTDAPHGHILTNVGVWSADGRWIAYDVRSDPAGSVFDGECIERIQVSSGEVQTLYTSPPGAYCGVVTAAPNDQRVVFIHGPEHPTPAWSYAAYHRRGVIVHANSPGKAINLDARDLTHPLTAGALRGGTHVHTFSGDGKWIAFTYEDHLLASSNEDGKHDLNQRNVGVSVPDRPVTVGRDHPRNHDGSHFSVLVTRTENAPQPGSDEICRAYQDSWIGTHGYLKPDGTRQKRALAFQGNVVTKGGLTIAEAFVVDLPDDLTRPGRAPLEGTLTTRPAPPQGVVQRRLTFTSDRKHPGLQGPRHWPRSSPDGSRIGLLMKDDLGVVQLWTVSPNGDALEQITHNAHDIASAFTWSPDGRWISHIMDRSVCITDVSTGVTHRLTPATDKGHAPRPEACVFSPTGQHIAYVRPVASQGKTWNQVFLATLQGIHP